MKRTTRDLSKLRKMGQKKNKEKLDLKLLIKIYKVFGRHYKNYWKTLAVSYVALFVTILISLAEPWPLKLILDHLILKKPLPESFGFLNQLYETNAELLLVLLALSIVVLTLLNSGFSYINKFWASVVASKIIAEIRERAFAHLQRLSLSFHESSKSGDIIVRLSSDVKEIKGILLNLPQQATNRLVRIGAIGSIMLAMDWRLALIGFTSVPLIFVFTRHFGIGLKKATKKIKKQESDVNSIIFENVNSIALVQAYGRENLETERFNAENQKSLEAKIESNRLSKSYKRILDFVIAGSSSAVVYYGARHAMSGAISPGDLIVFVSYLKNLYGPIEKFNDLILGAIQAQVAGQRIVELIENDMIVQDAPNAIPAPPFEGRIEYRNVSFCYKKDVDVLKGIDFVVEPGTTVALVGHSGAGKSTLVSLLLRFYDPQTGQVLIDGHDVREVTLKSLRDQITVVLQEAKLFNKTVRENIGFGRLDATEKEIIEAAKLADAHEFIMQMPQGYDTWISEGGVNLSGGQKQRINIARAIIRNTPILLLDEPSTALDAKVEAQIHDAIRHLTQEKTTFIIAHRFSTIAHADKILMLDHGKLEGYGAHEELMNTSPGYRDLYELQFGRQVASPATDETGDGEPVAAKSLEISTK